MIRENSTVITAAQFVELLKYAREADKKWPWLCSVAWYLDHATVTDRYVKIEID